MLFYLSLIETDEDKSKFEIIYEEYRDLVLLEANNILGDMRDSEDVVHQAFLSIIEVLQKINDPKCPQTRNFVVTIVERKSIDLYRKRKRHTVISIDDEFINVPAPSEIDSVPERTDFAKAMAMLPTRYREILLLKYDSGFSEKEIAKLLTMTPANVKKTVYRAKVKLAALLDKQEV